MIIKYFKDISKIPRSSFNEKDISVFLIEFAKKRSLQYYQDSIGNVIIYKNASNGYENHEKVILQGHTDMVAEKNNNSNHNFETDPIEVIESHDWLHANNTTLGADNGVAVAYMLSILSDTDLKHPALECVFTVQEEVGLKGAKELDYSKLESRRLIGLDSSGEHYAVVSSSGGIRGDITYRFKYEKTYKKRLIIDVKGLIGGHSGGDIDKERANSIKIAGSLSKYLLKEFDLGINKIEGGLKENAIPRECQIILGIREDQENEIIRSITSFEKEIRDIFSISDSSISINVSSQEKDTYVMSSSSTLELINLLSLMPYGYFKKSSTLKNLVIHSMNVGTIKTSENNVFIGISIRSPQDFLLNESVDNINIICELCHAEVRYHSRYPGWNFDKDSKLLNILKDTYYQIYENDIQIKATHGGLELGIFKSNIDDLDIVSFGPIMENIHTPSERLNISSFERTYILLTSLLENL